MLKTSQAKIQKYAKYLRSLLDEDTTNQTDLEIIERFRFCFCCGEEVITKSEQLHSILEFDTPKRAHEKICKAANVTDFVDGEM